MKLKLIPQAAAVLAFILACLLYMVAFGAEPLSLTPQQLANIPPSPATITVSPETSEAYEPVTATLDTDIPDGATVYGNGWTYSAKVKVLPVSTTVMHVWAPPGKHSIAYNGVWVHTKQIVIIDKDGNEQTINSLLGIGLIDSTASFTVGDSDDGDDDGVDPNPPLPPPSRLRATIMVEKDAQQGAAEGVFLFQHIQAVKKYLRGLGMHCQDVDNDEDVWGSYDSYRKKSSPNSKLPVIVLTALTADGDDDKEVAIVAFGATEGGTISELKRLGVK